MRPLHLTIEGLRSFRARVSIDFTGRGHVAIVGDTGAGKSSILEANHLRPLRTDDLHRPGEPGADERHVHAPPGRAPVPPVRRDLGGRPHPAPRRAGQGRAGHRATAPRRRRRRRGRAGRTGQARQRPHQSLLGLDSDAFLRTVVLRRAVSPGCSWRTGRPNRGRILRQVWRTDELEAAGALAGAARQEAERLRVRLEQGRFRPIRKTPPRIAPAWWRTLERAGRHAADASEDERAASTARKGGARGWRRRGGRRGPSSTGYMRSTAGARRPACSPSPRSTGGCGKRP